MNPDKNNYNYTTTAKNAKKSRYKIQMEEESTQNITTPKIIFNNPTVAPIYSSSETVPKLTFHYSTSIPNTNLELPSGMIVNNSNNPNLNFAGIPISYASKIQQKTRNQEQIQANQEQKHSQYSNSNTQYQANQSVSNLPENVLNRLVQTGNLQSSTTNTTLIHRNSVNSCNSMINSNFLQTSEINGTKSINNSQVLPTNSTTTATLNDSSTFYPKKHTNLRNGKKPCNCTKSQCLKLYCECFARGEYCNVDFCNCKNCFNTSNYETERKRAIRQCLERNPDSFKTS